MTSVWIDRPYGQKLELSPTTNLLRILPGRNTSMGSTKEVDEHGLKAHPDSPLEYLRVIKGPATVESPERQLVLRMKCDCGDRDVITEVPLVQGSEGIIVEHRKGMYHVVENRSREEVLVEATLLQKLPNLSVRPFIE